MNQTLPGLRPSLPGAGVWRSHLEDGGSDPSQPCQRETPPPPTLKARETVPSVPLTVPLWRCRRCGDLWSFRKVPEGDRCGCGKRLTHVLEPAPPVYSSKEAKWDARPRATSEVRKSELSARSARRASRRSGCGSGSLGWLVGPDGDTGKVKSCALRCNTRGCDACDARRATGAARRIARMVRTFNGHRTMYTLGISSRVVSKVDSYTFFQAAQRKWWKGVVRKFPALKGRPKAWVIEPHQSGWAHCHICVAGEVPYMPYKWLIDAWRTACGEQAASVHVRRTSKDTDPEKAGWYLAKYLLKSAASIGIEVLDAIGRRRLWGMSNGWTMTCIPIWPWMLLVGTRDPLTAPEDLEKALKQKT